MDPILLAFLMIVLFAGPKLWTRYIFYKYSRDRDDIPGTGGELVEHLLERLALKRVQLQPSRSRSHYDPTIKAVRLSEHTMNGTSLTAVVRGAWCV